mmetsp:Transcript_5512/g.11229  ORF Transcript_5512/g.11229 Transcript_5512/m.11229 type:complete len:208 (-) Transcript_5512:312-935(-)
MRGRLIRSRHRRLRPGDRSRLGRHISGAAHRDRRSVGSPLARCLDCIGGLRGVAPHAALGLWLLAVRYEVAPLSDCTHRLVLRVLVRAGHTVCEGATVGEPCGRHDPPRRVGLRHDTSRCECLHLALLLLVGAAAREHRAARDPDPCCIPRRGMECQRACLSDHLLGDDPLVRGPVPLLAGRKAVLVWRACPRSPAGDASALLQPHH